ncbi:hypothetical protein E3T23_02860 [Cryobacterium cheniae]|uniref:Uncharacterized protein n=1 Tax=Cryobacterium cheniae TaxID=1259262 RepID=A0A4R8XVU7_9MICO|nr:hypothetical protein [Cryobacterium cheniae]TFC83325.1 hypothetical protein E3T23_02860 [Cryobacterium cheniae]
MLLDASWGPVQTITSGIWPIPSKKFTERRPAPDPAAVMELAEIIVENKGRSPVTVLEIGFEWKGERRGAFRRRVVHHATPRIFSLRNYGDRKYIEKSEVRLEPYDGVSMLFDLWTLFEPGRVSPGHVRKLRASVRVSGKSWKSRSSRRKQWKIPDSAVSSIANRSRLTVRGIVTRSVMRITGADVTVVSNPGYIGRLVEQHLGGRWPTEFEKSHELLRSYFETSSEIKAMVHDTETLSLRFNIEYAIQRDLDTHRDLIDWSDIAMPQPDSVPGVIVQHD